MQARVSELKTLEYDLEQVREHNDRLIDTSNAMQDEIEALNKHMNLITTQNYELSSELQRFLQTDEVVKSKLNRRSIVEEIKNKVDTAIRRSQHEVQQRRSPTRPNEPSMRSKAMPPLTQANVFEQKGRNSVRPTYDRDNSPLRTKSPPRAKYN
jgi:chromosome segregation ATPase